MYKIEIQNIKAALTMEGKLWMQKKKKSIKIQNSP